MTSPNARSPLATQVEGVRDPKLGRIRPVYGYLLHTTGGGVCTAAKKHGTTPLLEAIKVYIASQNGSNGYTWGGPHYVIDYDGSIHQVAPDDVETAHCGAPNVREHYHDGSWVHLVSPGALASWRLHWPGHRHPYDLFPSPTPNWDYVGVEMVPIGEGFGGDPMERGLRFTRAQHDAAIALGRDVAARNGFPAGWALSGRLVGHEDVDPISRHDAIGGWDPGFLRDRPYFDFAYVRGELAK